MSANEKLQDIFYDLFSYNYLRLLFCCLIYFQSGKNYHFSPHSRKKIMIFIFNSGKISYFFHNILEKSKRISIWTLSLNSIFSESNHGSFKTSSFLVNSICKCSWNSNSLNALVISSNLFLISDLVKLRYLSYFLEYINLIS